MKENPNHAFNFQIVGLICKQFSYENMEWDEKFPLYVLLLENDEAVL